MSFLKTVGPPLVGLVALSTVTAVFAVAIVIKGGEMSDASVTLYNVSFSYLVAWGVEVDRKALGRAAPFEYAAFMFFLMVGATARLSFPNPPLAGVDHCILRVHRFFASDFCSFRCICIV